MKILVVVAHPDDEILGCGGTINRLKREGNEVKVYIADKGRSDSIDQKFDTVPILQWNREIEKIVDSFKPELVFTHFAGDLNRDHQIISQATQVACRPHSSVKELLSFEVVGSCGISISQFKPDTYFVINDEDLEFKTREMEEKYTEELRAFPHPRSIVGIETLASSRGMEVYSPFAEAFMTIRRIK